MEDLTTPLLDAVHSKLTDPGLDCKDAAVQQQQTNDIISFEDPTAVSNQEQNFMSASIITNRPTFSPNTASPTVPLYCSDNETGPRQYNGCKG